MTTIDLEAWRENEIERYCAEAASGKNTDWAEYCENSSLEVLVSVYKILCEPAGHTTTRTQVTECRDLVEALITKAAEAHADSILEDCRCYAPAVRYDSVSPPEPVVNRDCPVHGDPER